MKSEHAKLLLVVLRTCTVAVKDLQDVEHSVEVTAETLYEAIASAVAAAGSKCGSPNATFAGIVGYPKPRNRQTVLVRSAAQPCGTREALTVEHGKRESRRGAAGGRAKTNEAEGQRSGFSADSTLPVYSKPISSQSQSAKLRYRRRSPLG
jgi:hypothetical protein